MFESAQVLGERLRAAAESERANIVVARLRSLQKILNDQDLLLRAYHESEIRYVAQRYFCGRLLSPLELWISDVLDVLRAECRSLGGEVRRASFTVLTEFLGALPKTSATPVRLNAERFLLEMCEERDLPAVVVLLGLSESGKQALTAIFPRLPEDLGTLGRRLPDQPPPNAIDFRVQPGSEQAQENAILALTRVPLDEGARYFSRISLEDAGILDQLRGLGLLRSSEATVVVFAGADFDYGGSVLRSAFGALRPQELPGFLSLSDPAAVFEDGELRVPDLFLRMSRELSELQDRFLVGEVSVAEIARAAFLSRLGGLEAIWRSLQSARVAYAESGGGATVVVDASGRPAGNGLEQDVLRYLLSVPGSGSRDSFFHSVLGEASLSDVSLDQERLLLERLGDLAGEVRALPDGAAEWSVAEAFVDDLRQTSAEEGLAVSHAFLGRSKTQDAEAADYLQGDRDGLLNRVLLWQQKASLPGSKPLRKNGWVVWPNEEGVVETEGGAHSLGFVARAAALVWALRPRATASEVLDCLTDDRVHNLTRGGSGPRWLSAVLIVAANPALTLEEMARILNGELSTSLARQILGTA